MDMIPVVIPVASVATLATQLLEEIGKAIAAGRRFREQYRRLKKNLEILKPKLDRLPANNNDALVSKLREGIVLIEQCSKVSRWNPKLWKYSRRLKKLDEEINGLNVTLMKEHLEKLASKKSGIRSPAFSAVLSHTKKAFEVQSRILVTRRRSGPTSHGHGSGSKR
ncbi:hypothetical protein EJ110_NYTH35967 [Nymphaea thermarum]|nr:hypothetical protein EJ110_NYTH35967 [Nymphaea thermarum]